jgi:hypothetical protein
MAVFDISLLIQLCYLGIGFVAGRIFMFIEFALLKPKYQSYKVINQGEKYTYSASVKRHHKWDIINTSHSFSRHFHDSVVVLDPNYYRELTPQEMTANYYISVMKKNQPVAKVS